MYTPSKQLYILAAMCLSSKGSISAEELEALTVQWWGRGKGHGASKETLNLIREIGARFPKRQVPELYRGMTLPNGTLTGHTENLSLIGNLVGGYRSWSKNKAGARYYATGTSTSDDVLITWKNPSTESILMDCSYIEKAAKGVTPGGSPFDTSEFIADASGTKVLSIDSKHVGQGGVEVEPGKWKTKAKFQHQVVVG